tara:strand:- start:1443 stop:2051 length:609 start_codon:yes stop_codon:yes gene_type:complete
MDFLAGLSSGVAQTLIGHPLDTIKTNKQNNIKTKGNLYKGLRYPLISNSLLVGMQFDLYYRYNSLVSGVVSSVIITPLDHYKISKQNNIDTNFSKMINNFKRGYPITVVRETLALTIYFGSYDYMKTENNYHPLIAGGIAGALSWLFTYPIDTIKTRIQSNISLKKSIMLKHYWRGINITLVRAFIVNSIGFYVAENVKKII